MEFTIVIKREYKRAYKMKGKNLVAQKDELLKKKSFKSTEIMDFKLRGHDLDSCNNRSKYVRNAAYWLLSNSTLVGGNKDLRVYAIFQSSIE